MAKKIIDYVVQIHTANSLKVVDAFVLGEGHDTKGYHPDMIKKYPHMNGKSPFLVISDDKFFRRYNEISGTRNIAFVPIVPPIVGGG